MEIRGGDVVTSLKIPLLSEICKNKIIPYVSLFVFYHSRDLWVSLKINVRYVGMHNTYVLVLTNDEWKIDFLLYATSVF